MAGGGDSADRDVHSIEPRYLGLDRLFDRSPDAVVVGEAGSGRVVVWNPAASHLFGYSAEEAVGLLIEDLIPDDLKEQHRRGMARYAATGQGPAIEAERPLELPARRKDGELIHIELTLAPLENVRLPGRYVLAIIRDVTERIQAEEERRRLDAERAEFIANAAHELRTPLTTIYGYAALLAERRRELSEEQLDEFLATLKDAGDRVNKLIANLLDLSRIEHGSLDIDLRPVAVAGAVGRSLEAAPPPAGTTVEVRVPQGTRVMADTTRLDQVLINLLTNAYRYGGRNILIDAVDDGEHILVSVSDDGEGVPEALLPRLFDPFARGPNAKPSHGSGLGLNITKRLIQLFGADIRYEPADPDGGARFILRLQTPASDAAEHA